jgi:MFS family permease
MLVRTASGVTTSELGRDLALGASEQGLISSGAIWGYAAMTLFAGVLADSLGPRKAVAIISVLTVGGAFVFASAIGLPMALIGRLLMGVGTGITYVCALKIVALWFTGGRFATLTGVIQTVGNFGSLLAAGPLALAINAIGWRSSFNLLAVCAAMFTVLVVLMVRDSPESLAAKTVDRSLDVSSSEKNSFVSQLQSVVRNANLWKLSLFMFFYQMSLLSIQGLWAVPYMMDIYGLDKQSASNNVSLWAVAVMITCPFIGYLSDRVLRSRKQVLVAAVFVMAVMHLTIICFTTVIPTGLLPVLFFIGGLGNSMIIVGFAFVNDLYPKAIVGTALGLYNFWIFTGGAVSQQITGMILAMFPAVGAQGSAEGYRMVFLFCLGGLVFCLFCGLCR